MKVKNFTSRAELGTALAQRLKKTIEGSAGAVMLSGGHAPRPAYQTLGSQPLRPAAGLQVLYSDERYVPSTSEASNYQASSPLLRALSLPEKQVLRVRTELPIEEAAADYERRLRELLAAGTRIPLGLLGMGADGHTASLFSVDDLKRAQDHLAIAVQRPDGMQAVSVTPDLLSKVEQLLMVVVGQEKRQVLAAFLASDPELIAWRAVAGCRDIEVWCESEP
jgi:6-phosphogluconolactonase/glucosamine-6-phosphate isomerase/deaminase